MLVQIKMALLSLLFKGKNQKLIRVLAVSFVIFFLFAFFLVSLQCFAIWQERLCKTIIVVHNLSLLYFVSLGFLMFH